MKRFLALFVGIILAELIALIVFAVSVPAFSQDSVKVNEAVKTVESNWNNLDKMSVDGIDFVIIDNGGAVLFKTDSGLSESINQAIAHCDTVLDIEVGNAVVGKIIVYNNYISIAKTQRDTVVTVIAVLLSAQCIVGAIYILYLEKNVSRPFKKLKNFAVRIAGGNLDIPLEMDRGNMFGAFTESFDIMRSELKKARIAEAQANESKKELVAKLSHDIKTPLASIKAVSEVGYATSKDKKTKESFSQIITKADQINALVGNLFTATLEELQQLKVNPDCLSSRKIEELLKNSDYLKRAVVPKIPVCLIYADGLRLQQVFDNIFANSYKYANTRIDIAAAETEESIIVTVEDYGGGVAEDELPLLTEKYMRGSNASDKDGAGLGLYISQYFMRGMNGDIKIENGKNGLKVTVTVRKAGKN